MNNKLPRELVERIQALRDDDALHYLIDLMVEKYSEEWRTTPPERADHREHLYRMVQATQALHSEVRNIATDEAITVFNRSLSVKNRFG